MRSGRSGNGLIALLLTPVIIWSTVFPLSKIVLDYVPPTSLAALRFCVGALCLLAFASYSFGARAMWLSLQRQYKTYLLLGFVGIFLNNLLQNMGLDMGTASGTSLLGTTDPIFVTIFSAVFLGEALNGGKIAGLFAAFLGVFLVTTNGHWALEWGEATGNILVIASALSYSVYSILSKRILHYEEPPIVVAWTTTIGAVCLLGAALVIDRGTVWGQLSPAHTAIIAYLSVIPTSVSVVAYFYLLQRIEASRAAMTFFLIPVFSILWSVLLLKESVSWAMLAGGALIILGVWLTISSRRRRDAGMTVDAVRIPCGQSHLEVQAAGLNMKAVLEPKAAVTTAQTPDDIVRQALREPIGTRQLVALARGKKNVVIVTSDHTRPMPSQLTMPLLLHEIRRGQNDAEITILVATGLHRATSEAELRDRFGSNIVDRERIVVHSAVDSACVDMGVLPSGNRYAVNRLAVEADLLVCEGYIEPHFFAGFSGGRKSILPGVCSAATIRANHSFGTIANPNAMTGVLTDNPIHLDALHAARAVGVDFILNVALDRHKQVAGAFAGDLEQAHRAGCALVADMYTIPRVKGDIVITGNGGYPLDQNLYQCAKAISIAAQCAKPGAVLILAAACSDGVGSPEFRELMLAGDPAGVLERLKALADEETIIDQWCAQVLLEVMLQHEIVVVSDHLDPAVVSAMCMTPAASIAEALAIGRARRGKNAEIVIIPDGVSVMVETAGR